MGETSGEACPFLRDPFDPDAGVSSGGSLRATQDRLSILLGSLQVRYRIADLRSLRERRKGVLVPTPPITTMVDYAFCGMPINVLLACITAYR